MATSKPTDPKEAVPPEVPTGDAEAAAAARTSEDAPPLKQDKKAKKAKKDEPPAGGQAPRGSGHPEPMPGLIEGRAVHYCLPHGKRRGEHRAADITYVHDHGAGLVNLHVKLNGAMDYEGHEYPGHIMLLERVPFSVDPKVEGTWHWTERV